VSRATKRKLTAIRNRPEQYYLDAKHRARQRAIATGLLRHAGHLERVELILPARMLWQCTYSMLHNPKIKPLPEERVFATVVKPALEIAIEEPIDRLPLRSKNEVATLANLLTDDVLHIFLGRELPEVFLMVLRWLEGLLASEYLTLPKGETAIDRALEVILTELPKCPKLAEINEPAAEDSLLLLARLQSFNLYLGASIPQPDLATLTFAHT
jgi:hypothetical protein